MSRTFMYVCIILRSASEPRVKIIGSKSTYATDRYKAVDMTLFSVCVTL